MSTIPRQEVLAHAAMIERVQREAGRKAKKAIAKWFKEHPVWEVDELRAFAIDLMRDFVADYGNAASSIACDLYDGTMGGEYPAAVPWDGDFDREIERAVRYQLQKALDGDLDAFANAMGDAAEYYTRRHANETTMANCERDNKAFAPGGLTDDEHNRRHGALHQPLDMPKPMGASPWSKKPSNALPTRRGGGRRYHALQIGEPAFARVPTGRETCSYCIMLASRGFAYHTSESAGHADHRGCNCLIVAGRHGDAVEGVDTSAQYDCWMELEALESWQKQNPDKMDPAELERKKQEIVDKYGDALMVDTSPGAVRKQYATTAYHDGWTEGNWYEARRKAALRYNQD